MTVIDTYTLQIVLDDDYVRLPRLDISSALREAEENLTDLMPDGYRARITHWAEGDDDE